jgi:hypothetical protein
LAIKRWLNQETTIKQNRNTLKHQAHRDVIRTV